jgi:hypothetical protein
MPSVHVLFACTGHVIVPHAPASGLHVTSHAHELAQVVAPHAPEPSQSCVHLPVPHVRLAHAPLPVHVTSQAFASQVMAPHGAVSVHSIAQLHPVGHVIAAPLPVMWQVPVGKSHDVQVAGHTAASASVPPVTQ